MRKQDEPESMRGMRKQDEPESMRGDAETGRTGEHEGGCDGRVDEKADLCYTAGMARYGGTAGGGGQRDRIAGAWRSGFMKEKKEAIAYCLTYPGVYEDYPFHDPNWCVIRHRKSKKVFAWIFDREGHVWINVKCDPEWRDFWRNAFASVVPAYHLNKKYWNSIILDGTVPEKEIRRMIGESYDLTKERGGQKAVPDTITYYNTCAKMFVENTRHVDFSKIQNRFLARLAPGAEILDFGCGSGRDTRAFLERGYRVEAVDGSEELCRLASAYTGISVRRMLFGELSERDRYDGIWACASLLHLPGRELPGVFERMADALKCGGVIYASFKYGEFEGERDGRYFTDLTEESLRELLRVVPVLTEEEIWVTADVRAGRDEEQWVNILLGKRT